MNVSETSAFDDLLAALKVAELPKEEQEELLLELNDIVLQGTLARLLERMDEETRNEFSTLLERKADDAEMEAFITKNVPDAEAIIEETIRNITRNMLAVSEEE